MTDFVTSEYGHPSTRSGSLMGFRVKAVAEVEITVEFEDNLLDYGSVQQAVQDAIGYTGAVVIDVTEYTEVGA